jgi:hypothetical protein
MKTDVANGILIEVKLRSPIVIQRRFVVFIVVTKDIGELTELFWPSGCVIIQ